MTDPVSPWLTIAPINRFYQDLPKIFESERDMTHGITITCLPEWAKSPDMTEYLSYNQKKELEKAKICFLSGYRAEALGSHDPTWTGKPLRSIQELAVEKVRLCNLALWLAMPTCLNFGVYMHVQQFEGDWVLRESSSIEDLIPLEKELQGQLDIDDLEKAKCLFSTIMDRVSRESSLWIALRTLINALSRQTWWEVRYLLLWLSLESLFGSDTEIVHQISERIGFFLGNDSNKRKQYYEESKKAYGWRSKIVHGRNFNKVSSDKSAFIMEKTELFVRSSLNKILSNDELIETFQKSGDVREKYLRDLIFS